MSRLKVDTNAIRNTAGKIASCNNQMKNEFTTIEAKMQSLQGTWSGSAADKATKSFAKIKNEYNTTRYEVMDSYVSFLKQQVGVGFDEVEKANKKLADAFK